MTYATRKAHNLVVDLPLRHIGTDSSNVPRELYPQNRRTSRWRRIVPLALGNIHAIETEGLDLVSWDEHGNIPGLSDPCLH